MTKNYMFNEAYLPLFESEELIKRLNEDMELHIKFTLVSREFHFT